jgi:hypothetical protein
MSSRNIRIGKRVKLYDVCVDTVVERIKKMRALNCSPSDVGMDSYVWKKLSSGIAHYVTKF